MAAVTNKKISKIIIFFDSMATNGDCTHPPPLNEIPSSKKTAEIVENNQISEEESVLLIKENHVDNKTITSTEDESAETRIRKNGYANENTRESCKTTIDEGKIVSQDVILKIKDEPVENFEIENVEDEQGSANENVADDFLSTIKAEPLAKFLSPRNCRSNLRRAIEENANKCAPNSTLNELVNKLIEAKIPNNSKCNGSLKSDHKGVTIGNNNNASTKCKEFKCTRCTLIQTAFNALACGNCRQSLEPLWKLRVGTCSKAYRCKYVNCNKSYARQGDLKIHHRVHTGERPYACSICEKRFSANNNLRRHLKVHTGDKPFSCQWCGKRFMTNSCLKRHVRVHTSSTAISTSFGYRNNILQNQ